MASQEIYCKNQLIYTNWQAQCLVNWAHLHRMHAFWLVSLLLYQLKSYCMIPVDHSVTRLDLSLKYLDSLTYM